MQSNKGFHFRWVNLLGHWQSWLPNRGTVLFTILVATVVLFYVNRAAAWPGRDSLSASVSTSVVSYQGRLTDAAGVPLTGIYAMTFRLYSVASGGTPLWTEQWSGDNNVQVSNGLLNVMLGSLTPIPQNVIAGQSDLWLGITVGTDSEMTPRVQLGSVPFSMQAMTVPDGSIATAKVADGAITSRKMDAFEVSSYVAASESTSSLDWTNLATPQSIQLQLEVPATVHFLYRATVGSQDGALGGMALSIDGAVQDGSWIDCGRGVVAVTCAGVYRAQLSAGTHTVALKYLVARDYGGSAAFWRRHLMAFVVSQ